MIGRIIGIVVVFLIAAVIAYMVHLDWVGRKDIDWVRTNAEVLETSLEKKTTRNTQTTKYFDTNDWNRRNEGDVNVYVNEYLAAYGSTTTENHTYQVLAKYRYIYPEGQEHQDWAAVSGFMSRLDAERKSLDFPKGKKIGIYVQKNTPEESQIEKPDKSYPTLALIIIFLLTIMIALIIWFADFTPQEPQPRRRGRSVNVFVNR